MIVLLHALKGIILYKTATSSGTSIFLQTQEASRIFTEFFKNFSCSGFRITKNYWLRIYIFRFHFRNQRPQYLGSTKIWVNWSLGKMNAGSKGWQHWKHRMQKSREKAIGRSTQNRD